jgi:Pyruvate/2-oxoacid:ferredoxin oxidoreductase delta subunit
MGAIEDIRDFIISCRCVLLRYNPIRHDCGVIAIGNPSADSPVFVSGNYFHTVKRLIRELRGLDCYLLVADSAGINVWCAAGVCDFNEHKIADAVNSSELSDMVSHRKLILPPLAAAGINLPALRAECGFTGIFGPANLYDIKEFVKNGFKTDEKMRLVRFSAADRYYNAFGMFGVFLVPVILLRLITGRKFDKHLHFIVAINFINIFSNFMFYGSLPFKYPANNSLFIGVLVQSAITVYHAARGPFRLISFLLCSLAAFIVNFLVSVDMLGSTPFYKTTIAHWLKTGDNKSLFQPVISRGACVSCMKCAEVCPKGLFVKDKNGTVTVDYGRECCECLACVKQCALGAIRNKNGRYFKDDIKSIENIDQIMEI